VSRARALGLGVAVLAACGGSEVDVDPIPADYAETWYRVDATGALPGHGDSYRVIYANDVLHAWNGGGPVPVGAIALKEVRDVDGDGPGDVRYISAMRKLDEAPPGGALDDGWLFTYLGDDVAGAEERRASCWDTCHAAAPYDGLFLRYRGP
jgi:hypothetical protein